MSSPEILRLLVHDSSDPDGFYRFRDSKNHPYLSKIKIELEVQNNDVTSTFVHWIENPQSVKSRFVRVRHAYNEHGTS